MEAILIVLFAATAISTAFELSADWPESTPVFQAGRDAAGAHHYTNFREPVVVRTSSGRLVLGVQAGNRLAWPERSGQDLAVRYSDDNGKTWSPVIVAAEHGDKSCQCHGLVYDATHNRILFLYTTYNWNYTEVGKGRGTRSTAPLYETMAEAGKPFVSSYIVHSDDAGETWSKPREITAQVGRQAHFGASEGRQLTAGKHKGRLLLAGSRMDLDGTGNITHKHIGVWRSDDQGRTWILGEITMAEGTNTPRNASSEARITELPDGSLLYNQRTRGTGRHLAWSKDGGTSWTTTATAPQLQASQCNGSLLTLRDASGALTNTVLCSVPSPGGRSNGVIYVSNDGGTSWPVTNNIIKGNFSYSALVQIGPDSIVLLYETNHYKDIWQVKLTVADILKPSP